MTYISFPPKRIQEQAKSTLKKYKDIFTKGSGSDATSILTSNIRARKEWGGGGDEKQTKNETRSYERERERGGRKGERRGRETDRDGERERQRDRDRDRKQDRKR